MKKPIVLISNDWHLKSSNLEQIIDLVRQKCEQAIKLSVNHLVVLGDIFDSRISQKLDVLTAFGEILDIVNDYGLKLYAIPGNHDKHKYSDISSFLDPFKTHPAFHLFSEVGFIPFDGVTLHFIPFFNEEIWLEEFNGLIEGAEEWNLKNVLCTHMGFDGSVNNDGTKVSSQLKPKIFEEEFDLVLSGHYHDEHNVGKNVYHLPSIQQNNYGEDLDKGFTALYDDLSFELLHSNFKEYHVVKVDANTVTDEELTEIKQVLATGDINARVELVGSENKVKSINKSKFTEIGIDVKSKFTEIEVNETNMVTEFKKFGDEDLLNQFKEFCEENKLNYEDGIKLLKTELNGGE